MLTMLIARTIDGVIGVDGKMPWHIPADLKYFAQVTGGETWLYVGRKTYENDLEDKIKEGDTRTFCVHSKPESQWGFCYGDICDTRFEFHSSGCHAFLIGGKAIYDLYFNEVDLILETVVLNPGVKSVDWRGTEQTIYNTDFAKSGFLLICESEPQTDNEYRFVRKVWLRKSKTPA